MSDLIDAVDPTQSSDATESLEAIAARHVDADETETAPDPAPVEETRTETETAPANTTHTAISANTANTANTANANTADPDDFASVPALDAKGKENKIPHSRVKTMVEKESAKVRAEYEPRITEYETRRRNFDAVEQLMFRDPDAYMRHLAEVMPAYQRFLPSAGNTPQQVNSGADANQGIDPNDPQPQADLPMGGNQYTYSQEQHAKFVAWEVRRQNRIAEQAQQRAQQAQAATYQRAQQELQAQFEAAKRDWPGFADHHKAIAQMMLEQRVSMSEAYRRIVVSKLTTDRATIRDEVVRELRTRAIPPTAPTRTSGTMPHDSESLESIARRHLDA